MHSDSPTAAAIEAWLVAYFARQLALPEDEVEVGQPFASFGLPSVEGVRLIEALAGWLGRSLPPTLAWEFPTIVGLAEHLAQGGAAVDPGAAATAAAPVAAAGSAEPVAIIGMACRFPGAPDLEALWDLLADGRCAIGDVPAARWDADQLYDEDPSAPGKTVSRKGGFLADLDRFDARFFEISAREAPHVDPRQRLLLEVAWEALEDAGLPRQALAGTMGGVFIAGLTNDYERLFHDDPAQIDVYYGPGTANSILANRLSYFLDLRGPSVALDTACSGSLVALHLACQSLRSGEATVAIAGGVSVNLLPNADIFFTKAGALSPSGLCRAFAAGADGIVRSEGAGVVVLKPLAAARADGDPIRAVVRGSAVNHDGRSDGIMSPNGGAQEAVLRRAYAAAGVAAGAVQVVEAHGTGTPLGDPIEAHALGAVCGRGRPAGGELVLGSVKGNLGHLEAAAGIAGLIKTVLGLEQRQIPPSLHCEEPNPLIPMSELGMRLQRQLGTWPPLPGGRLAGVSSFGFGGTNAHVVLAESPDPGPLPVAQPVAPALCLLPVSARTPEALHALAIAYAAYLAAPSAPPLADLLYTAQQRRTHFEHRLAVVGADRHALAVRLRAFAATEIAGDQRSGRRGVVFVFSGQGSHWPRMGRELAQRYPVFATALEDCARLLRAQAGWSLWEALDGVEEGGRASRTEIVQAAIFAVQVALATLLRWLGVEPAAVAGQSLGEVAAAQVAGALSLADAMRVVVQRGRLMQRLEGQGRTAVVELPAVAAAALPEVAGGHLHVAGTSSPLSTVLAGDGPALDQLLARLQVEGVRGRFLRGIDVAFHGPSMAPLAEELEASLEGLQPFPASVPLFSAVSGEPIDGAALDGSYWARNLCQPFRFDAVIESLLTARWQRFVEISPHPVLVSAIRQTLRHGKYQGAVHATLHREEPEEERLFHALAALYAGGAELRWDRLSPAQGRAVPLPSYPWGRQRYWITTAGAAGPRLRKEACETAGHPLAGTHRQLAETPGSHVWQGEVSAEVPSFLGDHLLGQAVVVPAAAYLEVALTAAIRQWGDLPLSLRAVRFERPLVLTADRLRLLQVSLSTAEESSSWKVFSQATAADASQEAVWTLHAAGSADGKASFSQSDPGTYLARARTRLQALDNEVPRQAFYRRMAERGLHYGPAFQVLRAVWGGKGEALARMALPALLEIEAGAFQVHPVLLDGLFQTAAAAALGIETAPAGTLVPVGLERLSLMALPRGILWCFASLREATAAEIRADLLVADGEGQPLAELRGLALRPLAGAAVTAPREARDALFTLSWQPAAEAVEEGAQPAASPEPGVWIVLADQQGVGAALIPQLEAQIVVIRARREAESGKVEHEPPANDPHGEQQAEQHEVALEGPMLEQLLAGILARPGLRLQGIIHLWALDVPPAGTLEAAALARLRLLTCDSVVAIARTLAQPEAPTGRLWLVSRGAQALPDDALPPALAAAPLWGFGRGLLRELPELSGRLVDLDVEEDPQQNAAALLRELRRTDREDQVAWRQGRRWQPRLRPWQPEGGASSALRLRPDASYLITGGLGGLGLAVAGWMVERGARSLVLIGRSTLPPRDSWDRLPADGRAGRQTAALAALEVKGARLHLAALDVADEDQLGAFLEDFRDAGGPPIRGVVHAAGVLRDRLLVRLDAASLGLPLRPKVAGAWALHRRLAAVPLDFFLLFSSVAALLPVPGQSAYAAGNAFLDALAAYRRHHGLPALSINWGSWEEVGMAAEAAVRGRRGETGLRPLPVVAGLALLERLMVSEASQAIAVDVNWPTWRGSQITVPPLVNALVGTPSDDQPGIDRPPTDPQALRHTLQQAAPRDRHGLLVDRLRAWTAEVLHLAPAELSPLQPLSSLGLDSILTTELQAEIQARTGVQLGLTDLLAGPSLVELADDLLIDLFPVAGKGTGLPEEPGLRNGGVEADLASTPAHPEEDQHGTKGHRRGD